MSRAVRRRELRAKVRAPFRRIFGTTALFASAILVAIVAAGGTYAVWNTRTVVNGSTISAGSTELTINGSASYVVPGMDATKLLPGRSVISTPLTLLNSGSTATSVTLGALAFVNPGSALASNLLVVVRQAAVCEVTPYGTTPVSFSSPIVLNAGQSTLVCLEARLSASAPASVQGTTATFTIPLNAVQVRL